MHHLRRARNPRRCLIVSLRTKNRSQKPVEAAKNGDRKFSRRRRRVHLKLGQTENVDSVRQDLIGIVDRFHQLLQCLEELAICVELLRIARSHHNPLADRMRKLRNANF